MTFFIPKRAHNTLPSLNLGSSGDSSHASLVPVYQKDRDPTSADKGDGSGPEGITFRDACIWVNTVTYDTFFCTNANSASASWELFGGEISLGTISSSPAITSPTQGQNVGKDISVNVDVGGYSASDSSSLLRVEVLLSLSENFDGDLRVVYGNAAGQVSAPCLAQNELHYAKARFVSESLLVSAWGPVKMFRVEGATPTGVLTNPLTSEVSWNPYAEWGEDHAESQWQTSLSRTFGDSSDLGAPNSNMFSYSPNLTISEDGGNLYYLFYDNSVDNKQYAVIRQYPLSTPFKMSTASSTPSVVFDVPSITANLKGFKVSTDGSKLFIGHEMNITTIPLSTPFDLSSAGAPVLTAITGTGYGGFNNLDISQDGTKLYLNVGSSICQLTLSTPWDITTHAFEHTTSFGNTSSVAFVRGNHLYWTYTGVLGHATLATAWDISSINTSSIRFKLLTESNPWGGFCNGDFLVLGYSDGVMSYSWQAGDIRTLVHTEEVLETQNLQRVVSNDNPIQLQVKLPYGSRVYLRVKGKDPVYGWTKWGLYDFTTAVKNYYLTPSRVPALGATGVPNFPQILFNGSRSLKIPTTLYNKEVSEFEISTSASFTSSWKQRGGSLSLPNDYEEYPAILDLEPETTYYWRVRYREDTLPNPLWSDWEESSFTTGSTKVVAQGFYLNGFTIADVRGSFHMGSKNIAIGAMAGGDRVICHIGDVLESQVDPSKIKTLYHQLNTNTTIGGIVTSDTKVYIAYGSYISCIDRSTFSTDWTKSTPTNITALFLDSSSLIIACGDSLHKVNTLTFSGITLDLNTGANITGIQKNGTFFYCYGGDSNLSIVGEDLSYGATYVSNAQITSACSTVGTVGDLLVACKSRLLRVTAGSITGRVKATANDYPCSIEYSEGEVIVTSLDLGYIMRFTDELVYVEGMVVGTSYLKGISGRVALCQSAISNTLGTQALYAKDLTYYDNSSEKISNPYPKPGFYTLADYTTVDTGEVTLVLQSDLSTTGVITLTAETADIFNVLRQQHYKLRLYR